MLYNYTLADPNIESSINWTFNEIMYFWWFV